MFLGIDYRLWFIVILNFVVLSNIVTKALTKKEWTDAMKAEMDAWEKNSTRGKLLTNTKRRILFIANEY